MNLSKNKPANLRQLRESGWKSKTVKQEIHDNFLRMMREGEELFPGIVGYDDTRSFHVGHRVQLLQGVA